MSKMLTAFPSTEGQRWVDVGAMVVVLCHLGGNCGKLSRLGR